MKKRNKALSKVICLAVGAACLSFLSSSGTEARVPSKFIKKSSSAPITSTKPPPAGTPASSKAVPDKSTVPAIVAGAAAAGVLTAGKGVPPAQAKPLPGQTGAVPATTSLAGIAAAKEALLAADTYRFNPAGKTDPFKPFMETEVKPITGKVKPKALALSPLQRLDVDQFTLVGIAASNKARAAMVEDRKDKKYYPLFMGTAIGQHNGRVVDILDDRVIVEEKTMVAKNKSKAKRIILQLYKTDEVKP